MERLYLKNFFFLFSIFIFSPFAFSQEEIQTIFPLAYFQKEMNQLSFREEANESEKKLIGLLEKFFNQNGISYQRINYFPSAIIQSFSEGLEVSFKGNSNKNTYFVFPLDQREGNSDKSNNFGILIALKAVLELNEEALFLEENLHFLFLGGELTRNFPIGSRFFIENSPTNLNDSFFYYFEISNPNNWQIRTQGTAPFYITPMNQLQTLLTNLKDKKINFTVLDSYPLRNSFINKESQPFATYDNIPLPLVTISSSKEYKEEIIDEILNDSWAPFFYNLAYKIPIKSFNETNDFYLFFQIKDQFLFLKSSFYIIFIFILVNLIILFNLIKRKTSDKIRSETLQAFWFFLFLFFLLFLSLVLTSWLLPFLMPLSYNPSSILIYFKITFASFIAFSFLYLVHKSLSVFYKQSFLYMSLFFFFSLGFLVSFYNILSSFFFIINGLLIFIGAFSPSFIKFLFNLLAFASFFLFIQMGMSESWIDYFESTDPQVNLIMTSILLPFLLLIISYTTPSKTKTKRRYSRYIFSKIQISLLLASLFAIFISLESNKIQKVEEIYIREVWEKNSINKKYDISYSEIENENIKKYIESLIEQRKDPNYLKENSSFLTLSLEDAPAIRRNDYLLDMQFPFQPESLSLNLNTKAQLIPIIYKSSFPYEVNDNNELSFIIGPNPPQKLTINLSLEDLPYFNYTIKFSRLLPEEIFNDKETNTQYKINWYQEVIQEGSLDKEKKGTSNLLDVSKLESDPTFIRLRNLPLPTYSIFSLTKNNS